MGCNGCQHFGGLICGLGGAGGWGSYAAEQAAMRKINKYSVLSQYYLFQPIVVENAGVLGGSVVIFLDALGRRISSSIAAKNAEVFFFSNAFLSHATFQRHSFTKLFCSR